jgi:DNA polymerase III subunit delta'
MKKNTPTSFSQLIGNEKIKAKLDRMVHQRTIGQVLLFSGLEGIGKSLFAIVLAARLMAEFGDAPEHQVKVQLGQHPDLHVYRPEGKLSLHSIQSLRELSEEVYLPPYEASWKVFIIHEADRMLSYSANALLKTFEEPPPHTLFILLTASPGALSPTVLSRCQTVYFQPLSSDLIESFIKQHYAVPEDLCEKIAVQSQGSLGCAMRLAQQGGEVITARAYVLRLLSGGVFGSYKAFQESMDLLSEQMEQMRKKTEEAAKAELYQGSTESMSVQQLASLEKEVEAFATLAFFQEARALFESILSWYRDLHLLSIGGPSESLVNRDFQSVLEQVVQIGRIPPIGRVYRAVEEAYLALQRSTPLALCLENLFLKLDRVY